MAGAFAVPDAAALAARALDAARAANELLVITAGVLTGAVELPS